MLIKNFKKAFVFGLMVFGTASTALAMPTGVDLLSSNACSAGNSTGGISTSDISGSTECWGTFGGNDPGPSGNGFTMGTMSFDFVAKSNTPGALEGRDIDLVVSPNNGGNPGPPDATWSFDGTKFNNASDFLIVLKQGPNWAVWQLPGGQTSGTWQVSYPPSGLSHFSVYEKAGGGPPNQLPEPGSLFLMGSGLAGLGLWRWKTKK